MLFYMFSEDMLRQRFRRLGYEYTDDTARKNVVYYDGRTSHGSTLSYITHAAVLARIDPDSSWERFLAALESDVRDVQGGTTKEGIHMGVMAGTLDLMQRGYVGTEVRDGVLHFDPKLTERIDGLSFPIQFRRTPMRVAIAGGQLRVTTQSEGFNEPVKVAFGSEVHELHAGKGCVFALPRSPRPASGPQAGG